MLDLFRDSCIGDCIRFVTRGRLARFPEDLPSFELPESFASGIDGAESNEGVEVMKSSLPVQRRTDKRTAARRPIEFQ